MYNKLIQCFQELETLIGKFNGGLDTTDLSWHSPSPTNALNHYVKPHPMLNPAVSFLLHIDITTTSVLV